MLKKLLFIAVVCFIYTGTAFAQSSSISGTVTDAETNETIPGANLFLVELNRGAATNAEGYYEISDLEAGTYTLRVTFVGYVTYTEQVVIEPNATLQHDIQLQADYVNLGEIVVTGYSTTTKEKSSISSQTISSGNIENRPNVSVAQTLTGQVAGLNITTSTGQPGGNSTINLRGVGSINGNTEPLFILDGMPIDEDNFRSINPNEIASVDILKDAGATAIYGNRGANGVIIIKTKSGSFNSDFQVSYSGQLKISGQQDEDYNLMNSQQQLQLEKDQNAGRGAGLTDQEIADAKTTDWVDYYLDPGVSNSHTISISNGQDNLAYRTSIGYTNQDGLVIDSDLRRYNLRNNITGKSENDKFIFDLNTSINFSTSEEPNAIGTGGINQNIILGAYQSLPYIHPEDYTNGAALLSPLTFANTPLFILDLTETHVRTEDEIKLIGNFNGAYEIAPGLAVSALIGADYTEEDLLSTQGPNSFNAILFAQPGNSTPGFVTERAIQTFNYNALASVTYDAEFDNVHSLSAGAYAETYQASLDLSGYTNQGLDPNTYEPGDGAGYIPDNSANDFYSDAVFATRRNAGLLSFFGSVDYDYDTRYGVNLVLRRDASYRFVESNRWGTFYALSGRWNIHNESFMDDSFFDLLKLRGSYGKNGNQDIASVEGQQAPFSAPDLTLDLFQTGVGYGGLVSTTLSQIGNRDLRWESQYQTNIGLDVEILESRLRANVDFYVKRTEDLYQNRPVSAINSVTQLRANIGSLVNRGIDWEFEYDILRQGIHDVNLTFGVVGNYNKQEIIEIPTPENQVISGLTGLREGGIINEYYVIRYAGVNPDNGELLFYTADGEITENPDVDNDRVFLDKNIYPDVEGSINLSLDYKGAFLQTSWQYAIGVDRFDFDYSGYVSPDNIGQFRHSTDILDSWTPENTDAALPALDASNRNITSDRFLRNADFLRLRFVSLGYNLPATFLEQFNIRGVTVYANAENFLTFTEWRGLDPEIINGVSSRTYPNPRIISFGIDLEL